MYSLKQFRDFFYINMNRSEAMSKISYLESMSAMCQDDIKELRKEDDKIREELEQKVKTIESRLSSIDVRH